MKKKNSKRKTKHIKITTISIKTANSITLGSKKQNFFKVSRFVTSQSQQSPVFLSHTEVIHHLKQRLVFYVSIKFFDIIVLYY